MAGSAFICLSCILLSVVNTAVAVDKPISKCQKQFSTNRRNRLTSKDIRLIFSNPENIDKYTHQDGYIFFSEEYYNGDMPKAYGAVLGALGRDQFESLYWQVFYGTTRQFKSLRKKLIVAEEESNLYEEKDFVLDKDITRHKVVYSKYVGMDGLVTLAEADFRGHMDVAYRNVALVLSPLEFKQLKWWEFRGNTTEYRARVGSLE